MTARSRNAAGVCTAILFVVLVASPARAQNLVTNSHFDTSLTGWSASGTVTFDAANDANGSPTSGSAHVSALGIGASGVGSAGPGQCIPGIVAGASYDFGGQAFMTAAPSGGSSFVIVSFHSGPACGSIIGGSGGSGNSITSLNTWLPSTGTAVAPVGAQSAFIQTNEGGGPGGGDVLVNYDEMFFQLSGAVPAMPPALIMTLFLGLMAGAVWMARRRSAVGTF